MRDLDPMHRPLAPTVFSTTALPPSAQFRHWQGRWQPTIEMLPGGEPEAGFAASNTFWDLGGLVLSHVRAPALQVRRTARQIRRDQTDAWFLACARSGSVLHSTPNGTAQAGQGVSILHSMGEAFESSRTDVEWTTLFFSRDFMGALNAPLEAVRNRPLVTPLGHLLVDFVAVLERRLPEMTRAEANGLSGLVRQMLAACLAPTRDRLAEAAPAIERTRRERVRLALRRHLGAPGLTPARLAGLVGMSRSGLYRLFEPEGGVACYISAARLRAACAVLGDPADTRSIQSVAQSVGFADAATFSRCFRKAYGCTAREWRQHALACAPDPTLAPQGPGPDLPHLVRAM